MSFFSHWGKKKEQKKKKKWQLELSDSSDKDEGEDGDVSMACAGLCQGKQESELFCITCNKYYCLDDFVSIHSKEKKEAQTQENRIRAIIQQKQTGNCEKNIYLAEKNHKISLSPRPSRWDQQSFATSPVKNKLRWDQHPISVLLPPPLPPPLPPLIDSTSAKPITTYINNEYTIKTINESEDDNEDDDQDEEEKENDIVELAVIAHMQNVVHKCRILVGSHLKIDNIQFGWLSGHASSQWEKKIIAVRTERKRKKKEERRKTKEERRRKEEDQRKREEREAVLKREREEKEAKRWQELAYDPANPTVDSSDEEQFSEEDQPSIEQDAETISPLKKARVTKKNYGEDSRHVLVTQISLEAKVSDLRSNFSRCGRIAEMEFPKREFGQGLNGRVGPSAAGHCGVTIIEFDTGEAASKALKMNNTLFYNSLIRVTPYIQLRVPIPSLMSKKDNFSGRRKTIKDSVGLDGGFEWN